MRTDGGFAYHIHQTPASTGKNITLSMGDNGRFRMTVNNTVVIEETFTHITRKCMHDGTLKEVIEAGPDFRKMIERITPDSLFFSDEAADGLWSIYVKNH